MVSRRWLDETPTGRVVARCTQDIRSVDSLIPEQFMALTEFGIILRSKLVIVIFTTIFVFSSNNRIPSLPLHLSPGIPKYVNLVKFWRPLIWWSSSSLSSSYSYVNLVNFLKTLHLISPASLIWSPSFFLHPSPGSTWISSTFWRSHQEKRLVTLGHA